MPTREMLAEALAERRRGARISQGELRCQVADLLHNNAVALYRVGEGPGSDLTAVELSWGLNVGEVLLSCGLVLSLAA